MSRTILPVATTKEVGQACLELFDRWRNGNFTSDKALLGNQLSGLIPYATELALGTPNPDEPDDTIVPIGSRPEVVMTMEEAENHFQRMADGVATGVDGMNETARQAILVLAQWLLPVVPKEYRMAVQLLITILS